MNQPREHWKSALGFVLAAAGSAVGLGNLWKFPYIVYNNDGGTFVLVYLACIALVGFPLMISELLVGQKAQANTVVSFETLGQGAPGGKAWGLVGWLGVLTAFVILLFYTVIAGWSISSFFQCLNWSISGYVTPEKGAFGEFLANAPLQIGLTFVFITLTALIVMNGVSRGIEKATGILMPALFVIMLMLVFNSFRMQGFGEAMSFLFQPGAIKAHGVLEALGHAFFTLSLGMGAMVTYGSYMKKTESITKTALIVVAVDTLIALIACVIMYTIIFTFPEIQGSLGKSSVGMLFVTLPELFYTKLPGGTFLAPFFFVLVGFAALTSTISLLEVMVSLFVDKYKVNRKKATLWCSIAIFAGAILSALSLGAVESLSAWKPFGQSETGLLAELNKIFFADKAGFLSILDHVTANWLMPIGGFFSIVFVGWFIEKKVIQEELKITGEKSLKTKLFYSGFLFLAKVVAPLAIFYIIYKVITGQDFS